MKILNGFCGMTTSKTRVFIEESIENDYKVLNIIVISLYKRFNTQIQRQQQEITISCRIFKKYQNKMEQTTIGR